MTFCSPGLSVEFVNGVSVPTMSPVLVFKWKEVPQTAIPRVVGPRLAGLQTPPTGWVARNLTTKPLFATAIGSGVREFASRSASDTDQSALRVTLHAQHDCNCSS